jgi:hypothetical protein
LIAQSLSQGRKSTVLLRKSLSISKRIHILVVIDRGVWGGPLGVNREHFEVGFRSMEPVDYFLFIEIDSEKMPPILDKYHLIPLQG